jgi:hypothetical protein
MCVPLIVGPLLFAENTVTGVTHLDMLEAFCFPQLDVAERTDIRFQQDGALPHFAR